MKTYLIVALAMFGMVATASAQGTQGTQSFAAPAKPQPTRPAPPISTREVTGVVPRAIRGGNPLQMLNPRAPAKYGKAEESVTFDPQNPGKWKGIKLFSFVF